MNSWIVGRRRKAGQSTMRLLNSSHCSFSLHRFCGHIAMGSKGHMPRVKIQGLFFISLAERENCIYLNRPVSSSQRWRDRWVKQDWWARQVWTNCDWWTRHLSEWNGIDEHDGAASEHAHQLRNHFVTSSLVEIFTYLTCQIRLETLDQNTFLLHTFLLMLFNGFDPFVVVSIWQGKKLTKGNKLWGDKVSQVMTLCL